MSLNPAYARVNPMLAERLKAIKDQNRHYLAHEYFNRDWRPMPVAEMANWLEAAKLNYACSAHYMDHIDAVNLTPDQQAFLRDIQDTLFRETVRDFMVSQQFRRDYWVRGGRKLTQLELVDIHYAGSVSRWRRHMTISISRLKARLARSSPPPPSMTPFSAP